MIPAYWGQISNRTADPMAFIDAARPDARSVSIPGDDCVPSDSRLGGKQGESSGRQEPHGRLWLA